MLSTPNLTYKSIASGKHEGDCDRLSYTTYGGRDKKCLTILTVYRQCITNDDLDVSIVHLQQ